MNVIHVSDIALMLFLLSDIGWSDQEIADALLLIGEAIRGHTPEISREYRATKKLKPENGDSLSKLNPQQTEQLLQHLQEHTHLCK